MQEIRGKQAPRQSVDEDEHPRCTGIDRRVGDEDISAQPDEPSKQIENISGGGGLGPARKKEEVYQ